MKLALLTLVTASFGFALGASGCGRTDASAATNEGSSGAPAGSNGLPTKEDKPATPKAKGEEWAAEAKVFAPKKGEKEYTLDVLLVASKSWHVNPDYPFKFKAGGFGVELAKKEFMKDDTAFKLDKCVKTEKGEECSELHLTVKFMPKDVKKDKVGGELRFGVCSADKCKIDKAPLAVEVSTALPAA